LEYKPNTSRATKHRQYGKIQVTTFITLFEC